MFRIRFEAVLDLDSIRSVNPDPGGQKWPTKIPKAKFYVLRAVAWTSLFFPIFGHRNPGYGINESGLETLQGKDT